MLLGDHLTTNFTKLQMDMSVPQSRNQWLQAENEDIGDLTRIIIIINDTVQSAMNGAHVMSIIL